MKLSSGSKTQRLGTQFETLAKQFLEQEGLSFIEANSHCRFGEIDLIMLDKNTLCFIEVRYRGAGSTVSALTSINPSKVKKLQASALHWLSTHSSYKHHHCRFDCIGIEPKQASDKPSSEFNPHITIEHNKQSYKLQWIKNAIA